VGSDAQRRVVREQADYLIEPPMPEIGLRDWKKFDQAIQEGYDVAWASIEKNGVPLTTIGAEGPAMAITRALSAP
jgi:NTE family protein